MQHAPQGTWQPEQPAPQYVDPSQQLAPQQQFGSQQQFGGQPQPMYLPQPAGPRPTDTLAIIGFVCAFLFWPAALVLNPIALSRIKRSGAGGRGLAIAGLVISSIIALLVILAVALPVFLNQRLKAEEAAVKSELRDASMVAESIYATTGAYPSTSTELAAAGYAPAQDVRLEVVSGGMQYCLVAGTESGTTLWFDSTTYTASEIPCG